MIEKTDYVEVNASSVFQTVATYARFNSRGELVERSERLDWDMLFERMSHDEPLNYVNGIRDTNVKTKSH